MRFTVNDRHWLAEKTTFLQKLISVFDTCKVVLNILKSHCMLAAEPTVSDSLQQLAVNLVIRCPLSAWSMNSTAGYLTYCTLTLG